MVNTVDTQQLTKKDMSQGPLLIHNFSNTMKAIIVKLGEKGVSSVPSSKIFVGIMKDCV